MASQKSEDNLANTRSDGYVIVQGFKDTDSNWDIWNGLSPPYVADTTATGSEVQLFNIFRGRLPILTP